MHFLWLATVVESLPTSHAWWPGLPHLFCSCQALLLSAPPVACLQTGRTADWAAETLSSAAADAASPWEWIGPLSGSPSWCLENCRLDKKKKKKKHGDVSRELLFIGGHVSCGHFSTYLQHSWKILSGRPSDSDLAWMSSHTAIPSESARRERVRERERQTICIYFWSFLSSIPLFLSGAIRQLPLGDLMFTCKGEKMWWRMHADWVTSTHLHSLRQLWMVLHIRGSVQWCMNPRVLLENDESSETATGKIRGLLLEPNDSFPTKQHSHCCNATFCSLKLRAL